MGAVTVQDADTRKQLPIANVELRRQSSRSWPRKIRLIRFFQNQAQQERQERQSHQTEIPPSDYRPLDVDEIATDKIFVVRLITLSKSADNIPGRPAAAVGNIRVRYSMKAMRTVNVGSAVKTFEVENVGNVPCKQQSPCSTRR